MASPIVSCMRSLKRTETRICRLRSHRAGIKAQIRFTANYDTRQYELLCGYMGSIKQCGDPVGFGLRTHHALIRGKGYKLPTGMIPCASYIFRMTKSRKELMILYSEDVAPTGFTTAELLPGGKAYGQWLATEKGLIERAEKTLAFEKPEVGSRR
jgi:hypothetical protein